MIAKRIALRGETSETSETGETRKKYKLPSLLARLARPPVSQPRMRHWEVEDDRQKEN